MALCWEAGASTTLLTAEATTVATKMNHDLGNFIYFRLLLSLPPISAIDHPASTFPFTLLSRAKEDKIPPPLKGSLYRNLLFHIFGIPVLQVPSMLGKGKARGKRLEKG